MTDTTNQRMELTAALEAVAAFADGPLEVNSDSTYVVNCFRDRWYEGWLARDWKNSQRKPVANRDLWEPLVSRVLARGSEVSFRWVKGHAGNELNELADQLAVEAMNRHRHGLPPEEPALAGGGGQSPEVPWPAERAIVVTGTRTLDSDQLAALEDTMADLDGDNDVIVSGLRMGAELIGAELARRCGVPVAAVLPFAEPARSWPADDRARFDALARQAAWLVTLDGDPQRPGAAIRDRNRWLFQAAVGAIVVGDDDLALEAEMAGLGVIAL